MSAQDVFASGLRILARAHDMHDRTGCAVWLTHDTPNPDNSVPVVFKV